MSAAPLRWGVLGATSAVARLAVLPAIESSPTAELVAVASLSSELPAGYLGARRRYRRYEDLLADDEVEAVYIPLPNSLHAEWTARAAAAGRHVLCEKPLGRTAQEAAAMAEGCRRHGVTLMEAYMTPFHPRSALMVDTVAAGRLGELRFARCAFTGRLGRPDDHRWQPHMGGGALLDVGIYCVAPLLAVAGRDPQRVAAAATWTPTGVDASFAGWLDFGEGFGAALECSFESPERQQVELVGTDGALTVERTFTPGPSDTAMRLVTADGGVELLDCPGADPYRGMVEHLAAVVRRGEPLSRPPAESVRVAQVLDRLRAAAPGPG